MYFLYNIWYNNINKEDINIDKKGEDCMKNLQHQIIKFNNKDSLMEVLANSFEIGKVQVHMHKYDETKAKGQRVTQAVDIFVDIPTMLVLCNDILTGNISAKVKGLKDAGKTYDSAWIDMGGIPAKKLAEREEFNIKKGLKVENLTYSQKSRPDGKSLSRVLKIIPSTRTDMAFTFQAESGAGEENAQGLIVPKYGSKPENRLMMAVTPEQAKAFALMIKMHLDAFISQKYVRMEDENYYKDLAKK